MRVADREGIGRSSEPGPAAASGTPAELALHAALATVGGGLGGVIGGPLGAAIGAGTSQALVDLARYRLALADQTATRAAEEAGGVERLLDALRGDECLAMVLLNVLADAVRTSLAAKRRVWGRVIGQATVDSAEIDTAQLREAALRDLDAPHLQTLARLRAADVAVADDPSSRPQEGAPDKVRDASLRAPDVVIRGLERHGSVATTASWGGGDDVVAGTTTEGAGGRTRAGRRPCELRLPTGRGSNWPERQRHRGLPVTAGRGHRAPGIAVALS